jgi:hypothetical protein
MDTFVPEGKVSGGKEVTPEKVAHTIPTQTEHASGESSKIAHYDSRNMFRGRHSKYHRNRQ